MLTFLDADPRTIQLPDSPQSNPKRWSEPRSWPDQDSVIADDIFTTPDSIIFEGQLYVPRRSVVDMSQFEKDDPDAIEYEESLNQADQMGQLNSPIVGNQIPDSFPDEPTQVLGQETGDKSLCLADELLDPRFTISTMSNAAFGAEELQGQNSQ